MNTDPFLSRLVGVSVCLATLFCVGAVVVQGDSVSDSLDKLAYLLVGAVVGAFSVRRSNDTQQVEVVNQPTDPVPVDPAAGHSSVDTILLVGFAITVVLLALGAAPR